MPKFLQPINLVGLEIQNVSLQNLAAEPSTKLNLGRIYYDTADGKVKVYAHISSGDKFCVIPWTDDLESFLKSNGLDSSGYEIFIDTAGNTVTLPGKAIFDTLRGNVQAVIDTSTNKVKLSALPDTIMGQMMFGGTIDAKNVAILSARFKEKYGITSAAIAITSIMAPTYEGVYFIASGDATLVSGTKTGDWIVSNGREWTKIDNTDAVTSVVGFTGAITADQIKTALGLKSMAFKETSEYPTTEQVNTLISKANESLKNTIIGNSSDSSDANTFIGVRRYVDAQVAKMSDLSVGYNQQIITGDGSTKSFSFSIKTSAVVSVMVTSGDEVVYPDISFSQSLETGSNTLSVTVNISFATAPSAASTYKVYVVHAINS